MNPCQQALAHSPFVAFYSYLGRADGDRQHLVPGDRKASLAATLVHERHIAKRLLLVRHGSKFHRAVVDHSRSRPPG